jgi:hypothetical protein
VTLFGGRVPCPEEGDAETAIPIVEDLRVVGSVVAP